MQMPPLSKDIGRLLERFLPAAYKLFRCKLRIATSALHQQIHAETHLICCNCREITYICYTDMAMLHIVIVVIAQANIPILT